MCIRCRHRSAHGVLCATALSAQCTAEPQHCSITGCPQQCPRENRWTKAHENLGAGKAETGSEEGGDPAVTSITCLEIKTSSVENTEKEENTNSYSWNPTLLLWQG